MRLLAAGLSALFMCIAGTNQQQSYASAPPLIVPLAPRQTSTTTTVVLPAGVPADQSKRCPNLENKIAAYGLPVEAFSYIAWRESRCNPKAHNTTLNRDKSTDLGAVQINSSWKTVTSKVCGAAYGELAVLFDVDCNLSVAKYLYNNGGLRHWSL